jgi:mono/diheme cytochrome c family protein/plastocyanin
MTDTPGRGPERRYPGGREPDADPEGAAEEQRLPAVVDDRAIAPVERFTSPPSIRRLEFTPERAAQVVRQSANARWVGFLAVIVMILFLSLYWFYELGAPAGLTQARQASEIDAQQVSRVERGYLIYEANCARCHGVDGEGGEGPVLNRQDKLFAHLNEDYITNVLTVGGRYVCGNPQSRMPVWSDQGNPPGPLNYRQIEELIAFLLATNERDYIVRDEHLLDPKRDPVTGDIMTFKGWRDPNYQPEPGATPYPDCWEDEFASGGESPTPRPPTDPGAPVVEISASSSSDFDQSSVTAPADTAFTIHFTNQEQGVPHNVQVNDPAGAEIARGDIISGPAEADYAVEALAAGEYPFICSVHPNMTGTLTVE